jgi:hypothetical protein
MMRRIRRTLQHNCFILTQSCCKLPLFEIEIWAFRLSSFRGSRPWRWYYLRGGRYDKGSSRPRQHAVPHFATFASRCLFYG